MTFDELLVANKSICTMKIEKKDKKTGKIISKDYAEVPQRVKAFRSLMPNGCIETELVSLQDGVAIFKATVRDEEGRVLGTGTAYEKENSSFINTTSYIENCETSAVGRALAMCGFGIDLSIASYEEVSNAMLNQEEKKEAAPVESLDRAKMLEVVNKHYPKGSDSLKMLLNCWGIDKIEDAKDAQLKAVYNKYEGK